VIRFAKPEDMSALLEIGERFYRLTEYVDAAPFDPVSVGNVIAHLMQNGAVIVSDDGGVTGVIGGMITPLWTNASVKVAQEAFWWSDADGTALLDAFEAWASVNGADVIRMGALAKSKAKVMARFYRRRGYSPDETFFMKAV